MSQIPQKQVQVLAQSPVGATQLQHGIQVGEHGYRSNLFNLRLEPETW